MSKVGIIEDSIGIEWMSVRTTEVVSPAPFPFARRRMASSLNAFHISRVLLGVSSSQAYKTSSRREQEAIGSMANEAVSRGTVSACTLKALIYPLQTCEIHYNFVIFLCLFSFLNISAVSVYCE